MTTIDFAPLIQHHVIIAGKQYFVCGSEQSRFTVSVRLARGGYRETTSQRLFDAAVALALAEHAAEQAAEKLAPAIAIAIDPTLPTERAKAVALEAGAAEAGVVVAVERIEGDEFFTMTGSIPGRDYVIQHRLCVSVTTDARLLAHLLGFISSVCLSRAALA